MKSNCNRRGTRWKLVMGEIMKVKSVNTAITVLIAVVIVFSMSAGVLWVSNNTYQTVMAEEKSAMDNSVKQIMAALKGYVDQSESMVRMLASQQIMRDALEGRDFAGADAEFRNLFATSKEYWAAFVFDVNGKVVAGYNAKGKNMAGADRSSREYAQVILNGDKSTYLSENILVSKSGGGILIFAVSSVVRDSAGRIIGGVGLFPKWENFTSAFVDPIRVARNGYGFMLDRKGRFIGHALNKKLYLKDATKHHFAQVALKEKSGWADYEWEGREKHMVFDTVPKTGWVVAMSAYEDDMSHAANLQRNFLAIGGFVGALLLIGIMVVLFGSLLPSLFMAYSILPRCCRW